MDEMEVDHVIKVTLTNEILKRISEIDEKRFSLSTIEMPLVTKNRLRKNSKKKSSYASNKIEGNPLTEKQANEAIDSDPHKHFLKPEQEVRNYFLALNVLEEKLKKKERFSKEMILVILSLPINILTLGLFSVVINGIMLQLTSMLVGSANFHFSSFGSAMLIAIIMAIFNAVITSHEDRL